MTDTYKGKLIKLSEELQNLMEKPTIAVVNNEQDRKNADALHENRQHEISMKTYYLLGFILAIKEIK